MPRRYAGCVRRSGGVGADSTRRGAAPMRTAHAVSAMINAETMVTAGVYWSWVQRYFRMCRRDGRGDHRRLTAIFARPSASRRTTQRAAYSTGRARYMSGGGVGASPRDFHVMNHAFSRLLFLGAAP